MQRLDFKTAVSSLPKRACGSRLITDSPCNTTCVASPISDGSRCEPKAHCDDSTICQGRRVVPALGLLVKVVHSSSVQGTRSGEKLFLAAKMVFASRCTGKPAGLVFPASPCPDL